MQIYDGQTDVTKLIVAFHNFANGPKTSRDGITFVTLIVMSIMGG